MGCVCKKIDEITHDMSENTIVDNDTISSKMSYVFIKILTIVLLLMLSPIILIFLIIFSKTKKTINLNSIIRINDRIVNGTK